MDEYAILVKPIDYPLSIDELEKCWNCGGNVFRVQNEWAILKAKTQENNTEPKVPRPVLWNINLHCASCGKLFGGYSFFSENDLEEEKYSTLEDARFYMGE